MGNRSWRLPTPRAMRDMRASTAADWRRPVPWVLAAFAAALWPVAGRADSVTLTWTAPGDDGNSGRASTYELRYSDRPVAASDTASWWIAAASAGVLPPPLSAGSRESFTLAGLTTGTVYYFVIRTSDEVPNVSGFSNISIRQAGYGGALATPAGFTALPVAGGVDLSWEEPTSGAGSGYRLYRRVGTAGADTLLLTAPVSQTGWVDTTVTGGTAYEYRLVTYQGSSEGSPAVASVSVPGDRVATASTGVHGYPNPAKGSMTVRFHVATKDGAPGRVRLTIYDLTGRRICQLIDAVMPAGEQTVQWLCRSDGGRPVAPGLYNAILDGPTGRSITRLGVVP